MTPELRLWRRPLALAISLLAVWALWTGLGKAQHVFLLGFVAILLAGVFHFPVGWLSRVMPRAAAVVLVVLVVLGSVAGVAALAAPVVVEQGKQLVALLPEATARAEKWMRRAQRDKTVKQLTNGKDVAGMMKQKVPDAVETVATLTVPMMGRLVEVISTFVLLLVLAGFLVYRPSLYQRGLQAMLPRSAEPAFDEVWGRLGRGLRGWVGGTVVSMFLIGTLTGLGLLCIGVEGWFLLGLLTFVGAFVPYVGAVASAVPGLLFALAQSPRLFLMALAVYVVMHVIEGYFVQPSVMRRAVKVNPALLLFFQALMGAMFGLLGLVVATPLLAVLQIVVTTLWIERRLHKHVPRDGAATSSSPAEAALQ
jgi:predicted PurR-regulated permease PerM